MEKVMAEPNLGEAQRIARAISEEGQCDIFLYNGEIGRGDDLEFINCVFKAQKRSTRTKCRVLLITPGGDPDAAYKISRYLQDKYSNVEFIVSGYCKSAGTLIAMGGNGLIFTPYGELGPLDVQIFKEDKLSAMQSGLNISEALKSLEKSSINTYMKLISVMMKSSGGVVSFATAANAASEVLAALYSPIFGQIDPEDVGGRTRSMRIAADYGKRLDLAAKNMKPGAIQQLAETYSSHSFVIDKVEATGLFKNVRDADASELELVEALGDCSRFPLGKETIIDCLSARDDEEANATSSKSAAVGPNGSDRAASKRTGKAPGTDARRPRLPASG